MKFKDYLTENECPEGQKWCPVQKKCITPGKISEIMMTRGYSRISFSKSTANSIMNAPKSHGKSNLKCKKCGERFKEHVGRNKVKCPGCKSSEIEADSSFR